MTTIRQVVVIKLFGARGSINTHFIFLNAVIRLSNRTDSSGSLVYGAQVDILFEHLAAVGRKDHSSQISNYDEQHRASEK